MHDCVRSMLNIVRIIYDDVKRLEAIELPPKIEELYEPLGDMNDCIYFQRDVHDFGNADIKVTRIFHGGFCECVKIRLSFLRISSPGYLQHLPVVSITISAATLPNIFICMLERSRLFKYIRTMYKAKIR